MEMGDPYGLPDLRRLLTGRTHYPAPLPLPLPLPSDSYLAHTNMATSALYHDAPYMLSNGNGIAISTGLLRYSTHTATAFTASASAAGGWNVGNFDGGNSRWPRQETLALLDIRSRLDSKFKEANHKGPLWDEISRIMGEEYGYLRSGKKCREKFENLYKYYKKTKEGKAGKSYRFFKQLQAIYGETSNLQTSVPDQLQEVEHKVSDSLSSSSGYMDGEDQRNRKRVKKVKEFVDSQMKKLICSQDVWMETMLKAIEEKEQERVLREEEWRRREAARFNKEHQFWVKERAWMEARDHALMAALTKFSKTQNEINANRWNEHALEPRFQENSKQSTWEEIEAKMVSLGYERDANNADCYKKRKEDYFQQTAMDSTSSPSTSYDINSFHISAENQWERYGLKMISKGKNQQF